MKCGDVTILKMVIIRHLWFPNFENFQHSPGSCISVQNFAKIGHSANQLSPKTMFFSIASVRRVEFRNLNFGQIVFTRVTIWFSLPNFVVIGPFFTDICRHTDFHISGRPPSWICDDVITLHPLINFHGPNIVLNFHVDLFDSFLASLTFVRLTTDKQTRQTLS